MPDRPGLSVRRLSNSAIALLLASRPVTTRRISAAVAAEHANTTATIDQNVVRIIASLHRVARTMPDHEPRIRLLTGGAERCRSRPSRLLQHPVLLAEMVTR